MMDFDNLLHNLDMFLCDFCTQ